MNAPGSAEGASAQVSGKQPLVRLSDALPGVGSQVAPAGIHPAKKAALLSGPPPKVRAAGPEKASASAPPVDHFHRRHCIGSCSAKFGHYSFSGTFGQPERPHQRVVSIGIRRGGGTKGLQHRERLQSELASRSGGFYLSLMQQIHKRMSPGKPLPKTEADLKDVSLIAYLERHGGYRGPTRPWPYNVGRSTCVGLYGCRGQCWGKRVHVVAGGGSRTGSCRWQLAGGVPSHVDRRTATVTVSGSSGECDTSRETIRTIGAIPMGSNMPGLYQRNGTLVDEEERISQQGQGREAGCYGGGCSLIKEEGPVSEETKRWRRGPVKSGLSCRPHRRQDASICMSSVDGLQCGGDVPSSTGVEFKEDAPSPLDANVKFKRDSIRIVSFSSWCEELMISVLRSRTFFAAYVVKAIRSPRTEVKSTSAIYPMPVPFPLAFRRMPPGCSATKRHKIQFLRAMNVVVLALNFWWSDGRNTDNHHLGRMLNHRKLAVVSRIKSILLADGPGIEIPSLSCGRKFPQLIARLSELSDGVTRLGVGAGPYSKVFQGADIHTSVDAPELEPYRSLDSSRLKITGTGSWDATTFLSDELAVAYRYPNALLLDRVPKEDEYPQFADDPAEVGKLARLWDSRGLLFLHRVDLVTHAPYEAVRVFNNYKNVSCDRQIGDRRGRNAVEARVLGPSLQLPAATDFVDLFVPVPSYRLSINITDRSDFYHQFHVSENRALANTVFPPLRKEEVISTNALAAHALARSRKNCDRLKQGDGLRFSSRQQLGEIEADSYLISFRSIFQGDHSGVEIATDAHVGLLQREGLLTDQFRLESNRAFRGKGALEGLVIDDYFSIGIVPRYSDRPCDGTENSFSFGLSATQKLDRAMAAYQKAGLAGSPQKDVRDANAAKVIGGFLNSSDQAAKQGVATLGSPIEKRLGLSSITLAMCQLRYTTDVLLICLLGGWTSILGFRRQLLSLLNKSYTLVDASNLDANNPKLVALPREVCQELVLVAVLSVLAVVDLSADVCKETYATDASSSHGAIVSTTLPAELSWMIVRGCKSKGAYARILNPHEALLKSFELLEETGEERENRLDKGGPARPLAFRYEFLEVFAGAASVSDAVAALGFVVGPPIDLSYSTELDGRFLHIISWITYMISSGHLLSVACEPPCTTFSVMRRPALRDAEFVFGYDPNHEQTKTGNILAQRSCQISYVSLQNSVTSLFETPWSSKLKRLPSWKRLLRHEQVRMIRTDSCAFRSIHKKSFAFLGTHADMSHIDYRCPGGHEHVLVQGAYTKASASYTPLLAEALALVIRDGIVRRKKEVSESDINVKGLENLFLNDVLLSSSLEGVFFLGI